MPSVFYVILSITAFGLSPNFAHARPTPAEKATKRAAFWGLFANTELAIKCMGASRELRPCLRKSLIQAEGHAATVDKATGENRFVPKIEEIRKDSEQGETATLQDRLLDMRNQLVETFAADVAPALTPNLVAGAAVFQQHCSGCHGRSSDQQGHLANKLKDVPESLWASWRRGVQSPLGSYAAMVHGVEDTEMVSLVDVLDVDTLWSVAFYIATFNSPEPDEKKDTRFTAWVLERQEQFSLMNLARSSDADLSDRIKRLGLDCGLCKQEVSYLRRQWVGQAPRLGDYREDDRKAKEVRGLIIVLVLVTITSMGFGFILKRRTGSK